jgi:hypothetical protein
MTYINKYLSLNSLANANLLALWNFDGTANSLINRTGDTTFDANFNGSGASYSADLDNLIGLNMNGSFYVQTPHYYSNFPFGPLTIACIYTLSQTPSVHTTLLISSPSGAGGGVTASLYINNDLSFYTRHSYPQPPFSDGLHTTTTNFTTIDDKTKHLVVLTRASSIADYKLYIDGQFIEERTNSLNVYPGVPLGFNNIIIGKDPEASNTYFNGKMYSAAIGRAALSAGDILSLYYSIIDAQQPIIVTPISPLSGEIITFPISTIELEVTRIFPSLDISEIEIFIDGQLVQKGNLFYGEFSEYSSYYSITNGFHIILHKYNEFNPNFINIQVRQIVDGISIPIYGWSFRAAWGVALSDLYFADEYGIRRLHMDRVVGELKPYENNDDGYNMQIILSKDFTKEWPSNNISSICSTDIYSDLYLVSSTDKGCVITKNETGELKIYCKPIALIDGYDTLDGLLTTNGILYVINKTLNRIEVFFNAYNVSGQRQPDFWYSSTSIPAITEGIITSLFVVNNMSNIDHYSALLYVGCKSSLGLGGGVTRIDTFESDEQFGIATTYGIVGSSTNYPILGGNISDVTAVISDETKEIMIVATNDGIQNGGISQVNLSKNALIAFLSASEESIPSNIVRYFAK